MKILIDIGHPAHVHLFKNFARIMLDKGHKVLFTCRDKEFEIDLLKAYDFDFISFGKKYRSIAGKIFGMFKFDYKEWKACRQFKPDIVLSHGSPYAAHAAWLVRRPHISFEDTYNFEQIKLYEPFTDVILTSSSYHHPKVSKKEVRYNGYHELAYLHPNRFNGNSTIINNLMVSNEEYVLIRFVDWSASHDVGHKGISYHNKIRAVEQLSRYAKVVISSENELPDNLKRYQLKIPPQYMHDIIAGASLVFGESSTMAEEAAILGIPAVFINDNYIYYTQHLEKDYGLLYNFTESEQDQLKAIEKGIEILKDSEIRQKWIQRRNEMLKDKIDVTAFFVWFIENYPESKKIMRDNPNYQYNFK